MSPYPRSPPPSPPPPPPASERAEPGALATCGSEKHTAPLGRGADAAARRPYRVVAYLTFSCCIRLMFE
jgi:hypothetical protein